MRQMRGTAWRYRAFFLGVVALGSLLLSACGQASAQKPTSGEVYTLTLACPSSQSNCDIGKNTGTTEQVLLRRMQGGLGYTFATAKQTDANTLELTIPGATDSSTLRMLLTAPGNVTFIDTGSQGLALGTTVSPGKYPVIVTGDGIDTRTINAQMDQVELLPVVNFEFMGKARDTFATFTKKHLNQWIAVTFDDKVVDAVQITSEVLGPAQLSDVGNLDQAKVLAAQLEGALPLAVTVANAQHYGASTPTVSATAGK